MRTVNLYAALLIAAVPFASHAADGTITFNGEITDKTCTIASPQGKDFTVTLPTVSTSALSAAGQVAGRTPFSMSLSQCSAGDVATYFEPGATIDISSGRLNNVATANAASAVKLQLLGDNSLFIPVVAAGAGASQANSQTVTVDGAGSANLNYFVEYYATGAATPGEVSSSVKYTIIYN
ncbi:ferrous iron transporter B [Stenotrophomonas terrae]|uniref:Ferrous iron transporter B n=1 Tax=Stenotrophomonas terrae TaxID=405446 RepID=A0A0R0CHP2_9GAMM|nr:fimbrial protein [Stenotrophomonas terrae]KRG69436.1 ferrous iron transporter B [Stenotrophomonas terrae]